MKNLTKMEQEQIEMVMNNPNLIDKIKEIAPEITHLPGNWEFIATEEKYTWFINNVPFAIMLNWFE